jgi:hypothetical protein
MDEAQFWFQQQQAGGAKIGNSLRFRGAQYLNRTPASAGNRKTWTWSGWIKRAKLSSSAPFGIFEANASVDDLTALRFFNDTISLQDYSAGVPFNLVWSTSAVFRDPSPWYHLVVAYDTTQASPANTVKIYINGVQQTVTFTAVQGAYVQNRLSYVNTTGVHRFGVYNGLANYLDGYLTDINLIDGQALDATSFGEVDPATGSWRPKKYTGSYGTNGFHLDFSDAANIGKDRSGNNNNFTPNGFQLTNAAASDYDWVKDSPTPYADGGNGRGNYATLSPLTLGTNCSLTNGNLDASWTSVAVRVNTQSNFGIPTSGKWYWEVTLATNSNGNAELGILKTGYSPTAGVVGDPATGYSLALGLGSSTSMTKKNNNTTASWGAATTSFGAGVTYGIAVDMDGGSIYFRDATGWMNASNSNDASPTTAAYTGLSGTYVPAVGHSSIGSQSSAFNCNFGQRPFKYTPPAGFKELCTANLPDPIIKKPSDVMTVLLDSGANILGKAQGQAVKDLIWIKDRQNSNNHQLIDSARGGTLTLQSNTTNVEGAYSAPGGNSVAWCWKKGATPGFDIVTYTGDGTAGRTISHNLGVAPSLIIAKGRTNADNWPVGHASRGWDRHLLLNSTAAEAVTSSSWNNTAPTSSVFTVGSDARINQNTITYVAYLWSEVAGFSKFGSYTGNGSSDGPFVFCNFRPRWIIFKSSTLTNADWMTFDTARNSYNTMNLRLDANSSEHEGTSGSTDYVFDVLSNGFKIRGTTTNFNNTGSTYIFAAFAEAPFKYALAR